MPENVELMTTTICSDCESRSASDCSSSSNISMFEYVFEYLFEYLFNICLTFV